MSGRKMFRHGEPVEVFERGRWWRTFVDCAEPHAAPYGWVLVAGIPGRAGPFSAHISCVKSS